MQTTGIKNKCRAIFFLLVSVVSLFSACTKTNLYDKNISIDKNGWFYGDVKKFVVSVNDTNAAYNLFINVRHTDAYPFNNLWLNITTQFPDSSTTQNKVNVNLAAPGGEWTGRCIDGICYNTVLVQTNFIFEHPGDYTFSIEQDMRMNPIVNVLDVGMRLEKF